VVPRLEESILQNQFIQNQCTTNHQCQYQWNNKSPSSCSCFTITCFFAACMQYLVEFGEIYDVQGGLTSFLQISDRDLICEVFHEILDLWKK